MSYLRIMINVKNEEAYLTDISWNESSFCRSFSLRVVGENGEKKEEEECSCEI
jgi:hypothetical protein